MSNIDKIRKFKDEVNSLLEEKIREAENEELLENVKKLSLPSLVELFEEVSMGLTDSKDGEKVIRKYVKEIKGNKSLLEAYSFTKSVKSGKSVKDADVYMRLLSNRLYETVKGKLDTSGLSAIVEEAVRINGVYSGNVRTIIETGGSAINKDIEYLIEGANRKNLLDMSNHISSLIENIEKDSGNIMSENVVGNSAEIMKELKEMTSDAYALRLMEQFAESDSDKAVFDKEKERCLTMISEVKDRKGDAEKERFASLMEGLSAKEYSSDTFAEDMSRMAELSRLITES